MPTDDLAERVRAHARDVARATQPITLVDVEAHRARRAPSRSHRVWIAAVAAATVVTLAAVLLIVRGASGRGTRVAAQTRIAAMAASPLAPRGGAASVWTGRELVVWGGTSFQVSGSNVLHAFGDGAAYNPRTDRWRRISASPLAPRAFATAIWTGHAMFVWGGADPDHSRSLTDGAVYDPARDRWRRIADPPLQTLDTPGVVWTGHDVIVFGAYGLFGDGAAFNPATGRWRALSASPLPAFGTNPLTVWTGAEMLVLADTASGTRAVAYRPGTNSWRRLPDPPAPRNGPRDLGGGVWSGRALLLLSRQPPVADLGADSLAYVPGELRWRVLADPPSPLISSLGGAPVWTGREALFFDTDHSLAYDPRRNAWRVLPGFDVVAHRAGVSIWANSELLVWGGRTPGVGVRNDGARYIPSAPRR